MITQKETADKRTNWGLKVKALIDERGLTQVEFAKKAGLTRSHLSRIVRGDIQDAKQDVLEKMSAGFSLTLNQLREKLYGIEKPIHQAEDITELGRRLVLNLPTTVQIYRDFPYRVGVELVDTIQMSKSASYSDDLKGFVIDTDEYSPTVLKGTYLIADYKRSMQVGDVVAGVLDGHFCIGRLIKVADQLYLSCKGVTRRIEECLEPVSIVASYRKFVK